MLDAGQSETQTSASDPIDLAIYLADQNPHRDRSLGITSMTLDLVRQFADRDDLHLTQVVSRSSCSVPDVTSETKCLPFRTDGTVGRLLADGFHHWFVKPEVDLWYYPKGYTSQFGGLDKPSVGTMHDTIVQHYADHYPDARSKQAYRYWINATKRSLQRLDCVLTVSDHAAGQLRAFCDRYGIPEPRIIVTYEGSAWEAFRDLQFEKRCQVIHLASRMPHKQTDRLLQHWKQLVDTRRDLPELVLVGEMNESASKLAASLRGVTLRPRLPLEQLRTAIGESAALILPSEIEGFGLPAVEAYYVGTPVCYARGTSVDEILGIGFGDQAPVGGFDLDDAQTLLASLDHVTSLSAGQVHEIGTRLQDHYGTRRIADRIVQTFREVVK